MKKRLFCLLCLLGAVSGLFAGNTAYLFSYFINDSRDGLHLAYSLDGLTWTPLNHGKSFLIPTVGKDRLALWRIGCVYHCFDCRNWFIGCSTCTL